MARFFGINIIGQNEYSRLQEAEGKFAVAKREMEDLGWRLLNAPYEQQASDLPRLDRNKAIVRGIDYWVRDPLIGQSVDMLSDYVINTGMAMPQAGNEDLQKVLFDFWSDRDNQLILTSPDSQYIKNNELQLMGNIFLTAFVNKGNGHVKFSDLPPREVVDIICDPDNRKKHLYYKRETVEYAYDFKSGTYSAGETKTLYYKNWRFEKRGYGPESVADGLVFHLSTNRLSDGKFGNPRVMRIVDWVRAYNEYMKSRVSLMRALAQFAWRRKVKGNPSDVRKIANAWAAGQLASDGGDGSYQPPAQYAATVTTNDAVSWDPIKTDTGGASAQIDGRMIKGQVGVGYGFPLHYLGDVGSANLATATSMELPVLKMVERMQGYWISAFEDIIDFVIAMAIRYGDLPYAQTGKFSEESMNSGAFMEAAGSSGRGEYEYKIALPSIMRRQVSETINAAINVVKGIDPYAQNVEASRWALQFALEVLGEKQPQSIIDKVFPDDFEYPMNDGTNRGRTEQTPGDGMGQPDLKAERKPSSESRLGQKGMKQARMPGEIPTSTIESALLDAIDAAFDHIDSAPVDATDSTDA